MLQELPSSSLSRNPRFVWPPRPSRDGLWTSWVVLELTPTSLNPILQEPQQEIFSADPWPVSSYVNLLTGAFHLVFTRSFIKDIFDWPVFFNFENIMHLELHSKCFTILGFWKNQRLRLEPWLFHIVLWDMWCFSCQYLCLWAKLLQVQSS